MLPVLRDTRLAPVNRLSALFDRLFDAPAAPAWHALPLSLWQDEDRVHVQADVPGMDEKDIDVTFHQGELLIRGERSREEKHGGYDTRSYGRFEQRIELPCPVQADKAEAKLANGVLTLSFPKAEDAKPRRIALAQK